MLCFHYTIDERGDLCFRKGRKCERNPSGVPFAFNSRPQATVCAADRFRTNKKDTLKRVFFYWCERWDLNPHDLTDTSTSSLPVCRFQHARERNFRYYNKIPLFVKRQSEKLPRNRFHHFRGKEKTLEALWLQGFSCWCARRDLNPHARNEH